MTNHNDSLLLNASVPLLEADSSTLFIFGQPFSHKQLSAPRATVSTNPAQVFGAGSELHTSTIQPLPAERYPLSSTTVFQASVLLLAIAYCLLLYFFRPSLVSLVKISRGKLYTIKLLEESSYTFALFMSMSSMLSVLTSSIIIVRLAEVFVPAAITATMPQWIIELAIPLTAATIGLIMGFRWALMGVVGWITMSGAFISTVWDMRKMSMALSSLAITVPLLLLALNTGSTQFVMVIVVVILSVIALGFMLHKTYMLFVLQNVSILRWFLYLCAVEIFPVTLAVALALKSI